MKFVKIEDLREGMRIARPIYSKKGVLLFERDSKLNDKGIDSIRNFGLLGLFVLDPAEPAPPMTIDDIEFERFQSIHAFSIRDELTYMIAHQKSSKINTIVAEILKNYGNLEKKINFVQSLRTKEDYIFRHSLNVAMLCALIGHKYNMRREDLNETMEAAIVHDIGRLQAPEEILDKDERDISDELILERYQQNGFELVDSLFQSSPNVKRIAYQSLLLLQKFRDGLDAGSMKIVEGTKIMVVAEYFDTMTAMRFGEQPESELTVIRTMQHNPQIFDPGAVGALVNAINILSKGVSVVLNTGDTALILNENPRNILKPMILNFKDNAIMNLDDDYTYGDIEIVDILRTLDNRIVIDKDAFKSETDDGEV